MTHSAENDTDALTLPATSRIDRDMNTGTPRMVVTDCCGQLLPESQTLVGDTHFSDLCPACLWLAEQVGEQPEHERHVSCDWSQGIECPGRYWSYVDGQVVAAPSEERGHNNSRPIPPAEPCRECGGSGLVPEQHDGGTHHIHCPQGCPTPPAEKGQANA